MAEADWLEQITSRVEAQPRCLVGGSVANPDQTSAVAVAGRLKDASGRLASSRAQLDVQLAAVREARAQVRRVFWFVPGV